MSEIFYQDIDLVYIRKQLAEYFSNEELKTLSFDLGIEFEDLSGDTRESKTRELIKFCYRKGLLVKMLDLCQEARPHVTWELNDEIVGETLDLSNSKQPLRRWIQLVKAFNRNRHLPFSNDRTVQGDEIAFQMREFAPNVFEKFDVSLWLKNKSIGKRLAAIEFLSWLQDIEYFEELVDKLFEESPFIQFRILLALDSMLDQLDTNQEKYLDAQLNKYAPGNGSSRAYWKNKILKSIDLDREHID